MKNRKRNRMQGFDYSKDAIYFITSCTKNRIHHFGEIMDGKMQLNDFGEIAKNQLEWLEKQYPYIELHNYIVMPNHIHILMEINRVAGSGRDLTNNNDDLSNNDWETVNVGTGRGFVGTGRDLSLRRKIKSISSIMGAYKTTTSKQIHLLENYEFSWQRSFHDHIVRNENSFNNIYNYITDNPSRWKEDTFNKETNPNFNEDE
jgi:REP element-mobilizing transposase RayT